MTSRQVERKPTVKYRLKFVPDAWREWQALDGSIKQALKPLLAKRLQNPHVPGALLHRELAGCYKVKLLKQGYRLVYVVEGDELVVLVLAVGKREDNAAYQAAAKRVK
ncbi:type II toxin-antitoxin system RelE family toxin [Candidatus Nitrotoga sp. 1052]|uniref:type II toxin-antitoxin system RelE family toxin n=1 Tax=Candidatus Nitrotoga sp. 1052 TaxID=2886964 RepID=UPI001EF56124|nr:type II toxin-antitoxin system RelE/ParE family toxin [Candidatus Nitrotoga sp. 1052]CAH1086159.1 putative RelE-like toxin protein [Candidatus Nitrotoga sp. 1052]